MTLKLHLFGPPRIEQNGRPVELNLRKGQALLTYLAVEGNTQSRDVMAAMFWPESNQSSARASLRRTLYQVNKVFENEVVEATAETMQLVNDLDLWLDTAVFRDKISCLKDQNPDTTLSPACHSLLTEAASLQQDTFLSGFSLTDCPQFDEWQFFQQEDLRQSLLQVLQTLINHHTLQREYETSIKYSLQWLELEPWHEPAHRSLMTLYAKTNQHNLALHQYEQCRRLLEDEFGIQPEADTIELYEIIKSKRWTQSAGSIPAVNNLFNIEQPNNGPLHNLPYQLTPFVGREEELADLDLFIKNPAVRIISLIGPGGMGKTRLALALAQKYLSAASQFPDGIFHVPLSSLTDSDDILQAIAEVINIPLNQSNGSAALTQLQTILKPKKLLLILDSFEHLLDGAALVLEILQACPQVTILVTSRERLYLKEEHLLVIKGLDIPDPGESIENIVNHAADYPAVHLFLQCIRRHRPNFELTPENGRTAVHICRLVAGMPLGLELAASWTDMLPLDDLADEIQNSLDILETDLRNVPDRQRSIRAVFDTSWQRLQRAEQEICAQLSIFRGGFVRRAAQQIAIAADGRNASLQMLSRLADKSLIQYNRETRRYQVHELLRQYGAEQLEKMPELKTAAEERFHNYFAAFLDDRREAITGHNQGEILRQIASEHDNIRIVWRQSLDPVDLAIIKQTYYTLYEFSDFQGNFRENTTRIERTIAALRTLPAAVERDRILAVLYTQLGYAYIRTGPLSQVEAACQESLALYESLNIAPLPGFGTEPRSCLGLLANVHGRFPEAQQYAEKAIRLLEPHDQKLNLQIAYYVLNEALAAQGDYKKAFDYAQKAHKLCEQTGNRWMMATILIQLGNISQALGQLDEARSYYQSSYDIKDAFNDPEGMAAALNNLGNNFWLQADYQKGELYFRQGLSIYRSINDKGGVATSLNGLGETAVGLGDYEAARGYFREGLLTAADLQFTPRLLSLLAGVARLCLRLDHPNRAAQLLTVVRNHPATDRQMREMVEGITLTSKRKINNDGVEELELTHLINTVIDELARP